MYMTFRWYGDDDAVTLPHIRQIPGMTGIVSALYEVPVGEVWRREPLARLQERIGEAGLQFSVVESIPVHEEIKLGHPKRDRWIDNYRESIRSMGELGIRVLCYNFMPIFDWTRTALEMRLEDGSTALAYDHHDLQRIDLSRGTGDLPGWATAYDAQQLAALLEAYRGVDGEQLWENLAYFLQRVVPVAEEYGVRMAIHPDDPPWSIFGLPRIIVDGPALERLVGLVDSPSNGVTFCTGSLGPRSDNDLPAMIRSIGGRGRINFVHCRNVMRTGDRQFHESPHPSAQGSVDMREVLRALVETGFDGPMRPDHGRMIWGERGRPGYGLYDRALGATYLLGLWEGLDSDERGERGASRG
jgi:mannonate dehydratase